MGYVRKTAPAYVQACCVLRGVTATNVGIGLYLENFSGTEEEKVTSHPERKEIDPLELCERRDLRRNDRVGETHRQRRYRRPTNLWTTNLRLQRSLEIHER